jgi:hypothetical protein
MSCGRADQLQLTMYCLYCCMLLVGPRSSVRVLALGHSITGNAAVRAMPYVPPSPFSNHLAMNRLVTQTGNEATLMQGRLLQLRTMMMLISHPMAARRPLAHNMRGALTSTTSLLRNRLRCRHLRWSMTQASMWSATPLRKAESHLQAWQDDCHH